MSVSEALKHHDPAAWAALYDDHVRGVWRFMHRRTGGCGAVADDLTAETFTAAVEAIGKYDPCAGNVSQWLYGIARRKLADHLRKRAKLRLVGEFVEDIEAEAVGDGPDRERVKAALRSMRPGHRDVLVWMYFDDLSVREIAERLNRTEKAVENLLYRARTKFRECYGSPMEAVR